MTHVYFIIELLFGRESQVSSASISDTLYYIQEPEANLGLVSILGEGVANSNF